MTDTQLAMEITRYEREYHEDFPLHELPPTTTLRSPEPDAALRASMRDSGLFAPIFITRILGGWYVLDGRRRIKAARLLHWTDLPAIEFKNISGIDTIRLGALSHRRSENPMNDAYAVAELSRLGKTQKEICETLGITKTYAEQLGALSALPRAILQGLESGKVAMGVAQSLTKLPPERQARAVDILAEKKKLTGPDVQKLRQVHVAASLATLPLPIMSDAPGLQTFYVVTDRLGNIQHTTLLDKQHAEDMLVANSGSDLSIFICR